MKNKRKILITGGFGFLGTCLNNQFMGDENYSITNISRKTGHDLRNYDVFESVIEDVYPDIIIHCAANVGSVNYVSNFAANVINDNIQMSLNLYKAVSNIKKNIIIINPLANCSYPSDLSIQNESEWWNGKVHDSVQSFGMSKKIHYNISECYKKQFDIKTVNLMLGGGFGEYDHIDENRTHAMNGIIIRMIKAKNNNDSKFTVWGTGKPIREWVYMPDVASLIKLIIENEMYNLPNPLNIGQEIGLSISDIANITKDKLKFIGDIEYDTSMQDGAPIKILGSSLFRENFPNFKFTDFNTAIKNTINYYINKI